MEHLPEFIANHWMLCAALVVVLTLIALNEWQLGLSNGSSLEPFQAVNLINRQDALIFDIRSKEQFNKGHIINAKNIATDKLESLSAHKKKEVIIVCESGLQAKAFSAKLKQSGFEHVSLLKGGMQAWSQADLPTSNS